MLLDVRRTGRTVHDTETPRKTLFGIRVLPRRSSVVLRHTGGRKEAKGEGRQGNLCPVGRIESVRQSPRHENRLTAIDVEKRPRVREAPARHDEGSEQLAAAPHVRGAVREFVAVPEQARDSKKIKNKRLCAATYE